MKRTILFLVLALWGVSLYADGTLMAWGMDDVEGMSREKFDAAKKWTADEIIQKNLDAGSWRDVYLIAVAANQRKEEVIDRLIGQLSNDNVTMLEGTRRLIIWQRITRGDILFEGKGKQISDDLFSAAGRANWVLRVIADANFGYVPVNASAETLKALQDKWQRWRKGKKVAPYEDPYETDDKGLDELNSYDALEAIIVSLKDSPRKQQLVKGCLQKIYHIEEMPADPQSPAIYCNPDSYSYEYLVKLTGIKERQNAAWWAAWWSSHKDKLTWDKKNGRFNVTD